MTAFKKPTYTQFSLPLAGGPFKKIMRVARTMTVFGALLSGVALYGSSIVYAIGNSQFGTIDLATGSFTKISDTPPTIQYLVNGPNHNLLTESFDGNIDSINPATGAVSVIGPTGFGDCSGTSVANLSNCELSFGQALGKYFTTDFNNNLYTVNPLTGQATLVGKTGIPALTFLPGIPAADGSFGFYDENLFEASGKLYANYDTGFFQPPADPNSNPVVTQTSPSVLYQIDPLTGVATKVADTTFGLATIANINGTILAFGGNDSSINTLDVKTGMTTFIGSSDENLGLVSGVAAVPEPTPIALTGGGIVLLALGFKRRILPG